MYQKYSRISWQREVYCNHFAPAARVVPKPTLSRTIILLVALALFGRVFFPAALLGRSCSARLLPAEQGLPGMAAAVYMGLLSIELAGFPITETEQEYPAAGAAASLRLGPTLVRGEENPPLPGSAGADVSLLVNPEAGISRPVLLTQMAPRVLIYHTHATESFLPVSGKAFSDDPSQSVLFLGEYLAQILETRYGIPVLHHREAFDAPRRDSAYAQARPVISTLLEENPQINIVVDLHRDGVPWGITTSQLAEENTARLLFVVGAHSDSYKNNLCFMLLLQNMLDHKYPGFCRGTRLQGSVYNQDIHPHSVLVEIGGHENNREEVLRAMPLLAEALSAALN